MLNGKGYFLPFHPWFSPRIYIPAALPVAVRSGLRFSLLLRDFASNHPIPSESPQARFEVDCGVLEYPSTVVAVLGFPPRHQVSPLQNLTLHSVFQPANDVQELIGAVSNGFQNHFKLSVRKDLFATYYCPHFSQLNAVRTFCSDSFLPSIAFFKDSCNSDISPFILSFSNKYSSLSFVRSLWDFCSYQQHKQNSRGKEN